jgi:hypothetical protein
MDERRFDELTKALVAAKPSRRVALRRLAGGALATVFGSVALKGAAARRVGIEAKSCGQVCDINSDCNVGLQWGEASLECFAIPDTRGKCDNNGDCGSRNETCNNGKCVNTVAPSGCKECKKNNDCEESGTTCSNGSCIKSECTQSSDCGKNKKCKNGKCVKKN